MITGIIDSIFEKNFNAYEAFVLMAKNDQLDSMSNTMCYRRT